MYLSLKQGVEGETQALKAKFDELQDRVVEADAKRDQVMQRRPWKARRRRLGLAAFDCCRFFPHPPPPAL